MPDLALVSLVRVLDASGSCDLYVSDHRLLTILTSDYWPFDQLGC